MALLSAPLSCLEISDFVRVGQKASHFATNESTDMFGCGLFQGHRCGFGEAAVFSGFLRCDSSTPIKVIQFPLSIGTKMLSDQTTRYLLRSE